MHRPTFQDAIDAKQCVVDEAAAVEAAASDPGTDWSAVPLLKDLYVLPPLSVRLKLSVRLQLTLFVLN